MKNLPPLRDIQAVRKKARDELQRRQRARDDLLEFAGFTMPGYRAGAHHRLLCDHLNAVEAGRIRRLMVFMPPRHGKSELASKRFPAWYLGRHPTHQVVTVSYGATLAQGFGRDVRNIVGSSEFATLFPGVRVAPDSSARDNWHTVQGGVYAAMGVGGGLTGKGAHVALIDDPVKNRQDAESAVMREGVWDWYRAVLRTRLMPAGAIVLVLTRWHQDDLAGRLLAEMHNGTGEHWDVLSLPALADGPDDPLGRAPGAPLWPEVFGLEELRAIERSIGPREWTALYGQSPTTQEGALFRTALLETIEECPADPVDAPARPVVRRWDLAATRRLGSRDPDWTVGVRMSRGANGRFYVEDIVRLQGGPEDVERTILATATRDGRGVSIVLPQDPGQAGVAQAQYLTRLLAGYRVSAVRETGDKATRAAPFAAQVNAGNVSMLKAVWNRSFVEELAGFPQAAHDDQVDAAAGAFAVLCQGGRRMPRFTPQVVDRISSTGTTRGRS